MDATAEPFEVRFTRTFSWRILAELAVLVAVVGLAWWAAVLPRALGIAFLTMIGLLVVAAAVLARKTAGHALAMRLDEDGITLPECPPVRWTEIRALEVGPMRPGRLLGTPRLVAAFLPAPAAVLPGPPQPAGPPQRWGHHLRRRLYGTNLVLPLFAVDTGVDEVVDAVRRLGGVPVRRLPVRRRRQILVWSVLGVAIVVVVLAALSL